MEGLLIIPAFFISREVSFLVDTGSDATCLMPADGVRIGLDYGNLTGQRVNSIGIGGESRPHLIRALTTFTEENGRQRTYVIYLLVYPEDPVLDQLDSLLGRDVLNRWRMRYDPHSPRLSFTVVSADHTTI